MVGDKMNIAVITSYSKAYLGINEISAPNHIAYCASHGYTLINRLLPIDMMCGYPDLVLIRSVLPSYDIILKMDVDALFMNHAIAIEDIFPSDKGQQIALEGIGGSPYNGGVMLYRNEASSYALIDALLALKSVWKSDQRNLCDFIEVKDPIVRCLNIVPAQVMNSYCAPGFQASYQPGDFIAHFYCRPLEEKEQLMREFLK
jgi:hypothetical protein